MRRKLTSPELERLLVRAKRASTELRASYYGPSGPPDRIVVTPQEERRIWRDYRKRQTAKRREQLVRMYLCWAFDLAGRYRGQRLSFDDAIGAANEGLMEAIRDFDPARGFKFATYSFFPIRRKILEAVALAYPLTVSEYDKRLLRLPTVLPDNAPHSSDPQTLEEFFHRLADTRDPEVTLLDRPDAVGCPAEAADRVDRFSQLRDAIADLKSPKTRMLLRYRYQQELSLREISRRLGLSIRRVARLHDAALARLRDRLEPRKD